MLFAVVGHGVAVLGHGDNDLVCDRGNCQLAGGLGDGVVLGHVCVIRVHDFHRAAEHAGILARVRALGFVSQAAVGVAVQQTRRRDAGNLLFAAVVYLLVTFARDGQGHGVINRDDVLCFVRHDLDVLFGGIVGHRGVGVFRIQGFAPVRRQCFADGSGAGLVVGHLDRGALQIMMDGVARGVELEVQLQHQRARARHRAGQHVALIIRIEHVLVAFLGRFVVFGHGNGRVRRALALIAMVEGVAAVRVLIVEFNGVPGVRVRRPDGVKDVFAIALIVHLNFVARFNAAFARSRGVPADKGIAFAGEGSCRQGRDGLIIRVCPGNVRARTAVGLVGQGHVAGTRTPNAGQFNIARDGVLVTRLIDVCSVRPAEEVLSVRGDKAAGSHHIRIAARSVLLGIGRRSHIILAGNVFDCKSSLRCIIGVDLNIAINLGIDIKGFASAVRTGAPAVPIIVIGLALHHFALQRRQIVISRFTVRDFKLPCRTCIAFDFDMRCGFEGRSLPDSINGNIVRGHCFTREIICRCAARIGCPAFKFILRRNAGRACRFIGLTRNIRLVLIFNSSGCRTIININDVILVAGIVEFSAVITAAILCARFVGKALDSVLVFFCNGIASPRGCISMVQLIGHAILGLCARFSVQHFHIVISFRFSRTGLRAVEGRAIQRHCLNVHLRCVVPTRCRYIPTAAAALCRPLVADICAILGSNPKVCIFSGGALPGSVVKLYGIHFAGIVYINDGRAIARNRLLLNSLSLKSAVGLGGRCRSRCAGRSCFCL